MYEIVRGILNEISLEALSLAHDLDGLINQCVPFKYQHISTILQDTLKINVNPSTLENILNLISSKTLTTDHINFFHDLNVEALLSSYSINKSLSNKYVELCSPILLVPFRNSCPK